MQIALFAILLLLTATACAATRRSKEEPPKGKYYPERPSMKTCEDLCKTDSGIDADLQDCLTECAVHTDLATHHMNDGIMEFGEDESYNEKGGKKMEKKAEADHPVEILDCTPEVDMSQPPNLKDIDSKKDGVIDEDEAKEWGHKACVPDEMTEQIFHEADRNADHVITEDEFTDAGEETVQEEAVDKALEEHSEGDDEYNSVQAPPLNEFDENKDGGLDEAEHKKAVKFEMERRGEGRWSVKNEEVPEQETKEAFDKVDADDDGQIEGNEYTEEADGGGSDMGEEIIEAAKADEEKEDPDDLARADGAAPAASMLSTLFKVRGNDAAFLPHPERNHVSPRPNRRSFGHAFSALARKHHAFHQRHAQKQHRTAFRRHRAY